MRNFGNKWSFIIFSVPRWSLANVNVHLHISLAGYGKMKCLLNLDQTYFLLSILWFLLILVHFAVLSHVYSVSCRWSVIQEMFKISPLNLNFCNKSNIIWIWSFIQSFSWDPDVMGTPCSYEPYINQITADLRILLSSQLNGSTVGDVHIKVSIARKQPMLDAATGKSVWASLGKHITRTVIVLDGQTLCVYTRPAMQFTNVQFFSSFTAVQNSTKGSYRDKRNQVVYSEDFLWFKKRKLFCHVTFLNFVLSQLLKVLQDSIKC